MIQKTLAMALTSSDVNNHDNNSSTLERFDTLLSKLDNSIHTTVTNIQMLKSEIDQLMTK
jgi:hypothetical protein